MRTVISVCGPRLGVDRFLFAIAAGDFGARQEDLHRGPLPTRVSILTPPPDCLAKLRGEERFENARKHIVRNADAGIVDGQSAYWWLRNNEGRKYKGKGRIGRELFPGSV
jgi:hypothetical protein